VSGASPFQAWGSPSPYAMALGAAALVCMVLLLLGWRHRAQPGGLQFVLLMGGAVLWTLFYAFEIMAPSLDGKLLWAKLEYLGIAAVPLFWFLFAWSYTGGGLRRMPKPATLVLTVMPLLTIIFAATNQFTGLMWGDIRMGHSEGFPSLDLGHGPWFYVNLFYSYAILLVGAFLLVRTAIRLPKQYLGRSVLLVSAAIVPWLANIIGALGLGGSWFDITPFAFLFAGGAVSLALWRWRLFSLLPVVEPLARSRVLDSVNDGVVFVDVDGRVIAANRAARTVLGRGDETTGALVSELLGDETPELYALDGDEHHSEIILGEDGDARYFDAVSSPLKLRGGEVGCLLVLRDVSEGKRAEEALRTSRAQLQAAMDIADLVNWECDMSSGVFTLNDRFYALYGTSAAREGGYLMSMETYQRKFVHPEDSKLVDDAFSRLLKAGDPDYRGYLEHRIVRPDGEVREMVVRIAPTLGKDGRIAVAYGANQDVTDTLRMQEALTLAQEQLRQSQKMEAVGQLAGGIAHDFNNLLTAILGNSDLALISMEADDPNRPLVEDIKETGERAAGLTRQILAFSRRQMLKPEVVSLNDVMLNMEPLLHRILGEEVNVTTSLAKDLWLVEVDPHQMEQVVMNLAVNGRDAMKDGGLLAFETANVKLKLEDCRNHPDLEPGSYAVLSVSDTGSGMDEETRRRVFEPFFTTKARGKGTGLGLSTVFGIIRQSGGHIAVVTELGKGSSFRVYLPVSGAAAPAVLDEPARREIIEGTETILVVEDEVPVRDLVVRILNRAGYTTMEAGSAAEVDALAALDHPPLDLLVSDVVLPGGRSGRDVAIGLRARQPGLPVVFMSGYTQDSSVFDGSVGENSDFLEKPFAADDLLVAVRTALDARTAGASR
jgi:two-component system, cell cycle sensor histidine kinase and response regulator CckA